MMAIIETGRIRKALLAIAFALAFSVIGCTGAQLASHGTDGIANFPIYGD